MAAWRLQRGVTKTSFRHVVDNTRQIASQTTAIAETTTNTHALVTSMDRKLDAVLQATTPAAGTTATEIEQNIQALRLQSMKLKKAERIAKEFEKMEVSVMKLLAVMAELQVKLAGSTTQKQQQAVRQKITKVYAQTQSIIDAMQAMELTADWEQRVEALCQKLKDSVPQAEAEAAVDYEAGPGGSSSSHAEHQEPCGKVCARGILRGKACVRVKGHGGQHRYEAFCGQSEGRH